MPSGDQQCQTCLGLMYCIVNIFRWKYRLHTVSHASLKSSRVELQYALNRCELNAIGRNRKPHSVHRIEKNRTKNIEETLIEGCFFPESADIDELSRAELRRLYHQFEVAFMADPKVHCTVGCLWEVVPHPILIVGAASKGASFLILQHER
jgi:hypothetical protein